MKRYLVSGYKTKGIGSVVEVGDNEEIAGAVFVDGDIYIVVLVPLGEEEESEEEENNGEESK